MREEGQKTDVAQLSSTTESEITLVSFNKSVDYIRDLQSIIELVLTTKKSPLVGARVLGVKVGAFPVANSLVGGADSNKPTLSALGQFRLALPQLFRECKR